MKKDKYTPLIIFIAITWTLLIGIMCYFVFSITKIENSSSHVEEILEETIRPLEEYVKEPKLSTLEQSIALCKNEYAEKIAHSVIKESERQGVPAYVIYALIGTESDKTKTDLISLEKSGYFTPKANSSVGCRGLTQISKEALDDFNTFNKFGHNYSWDDMFDIEKNIEVGVWHFMRYVPKVGKDWIDLYIIYNTGYGAYSRNNSYWIYNDITESWENHNNSWYFRNNKYPPTTTNLHFSKLKGFAPTKRFTVYLEMYTELFA